jgi:predicted RNase H-like HicB family nuclease
MGVKFYPAAFCRDDGAVFVQFLDVPQAFTQGRDVDDALHMAREVIDLVLDEMIKRKEKIANPTPYAAAMAKAKEVLDAEQFENLIAVQMIPGATPGKALRVMISIEEELLNRIDQHAGKYGRSGFLADAARDKMAAAHANMGDAAVPPGPYIDPIPVYAIDAANKVVRHKGGHGLSNRVWRATSLFTSKRESTGCGAIDPPVTGVQSFQVPFEQEYRGFKAVGVTNEGYELFIRDEAGPASKQESATGKAENRGRTKSAKSTARHG